jgi:hypothetical protein
VRLAGALLGAVALAFLGFAAFVQGIHDPGTFNAVLQAIGLPFFEMGAQAGLFWLSIVASVAFWTLVIYALLGAYARRRTQGRPDPEAAHRQEAATSLDSVIENDTVRSPPCAPPGARHRER